VTGETFHTLLCSARASTVHLQEKMTVSSSIVAEYPTIFELFETSNDIINSNTTFMIATSTCHVTT
jgi:hypothetical protein